MKTGLQTGLFILTIAFVCDLALGEPISELHFVAVDVAGPVFYWDDWKVRWQPVEKFFAFPSDALLQVATGGSLTLETSGEGVFKNFKAKTIRVSLREPIVVRLNSLALRKMGSTHYFLAEEGNSQIDSQFSFFFESLRLAWGRAVAMKGNLIGSKKVQPVSSIEMSVRSAKIRLLAPSKESVFVSDLYPQEVKVAWANINQPNPIYQLYVWKVDKPRETPVAETNLDHYVVRVPSAGNYFVQVVTPDGEWQSEVRRIHLVTSRDYSLTQNSSRKQDLATDTITLRLPQPALTMISKAKRVSMTFLWETSKDPFRVGPYWITVADSKGQTIEHLSTQSSSISIDLPSPGEFTWKVEADFRTEKSRESLEHLSSYTRPLRTLLPLAVTMDALRQNLWEHPGSIFYFADGL